TGWRQDLDELVNKCHQRGILLCVDGIQGAGVIPLDLSQTPVDFLAADGHKWLLGPEGAGLLFIRREHLDRLRPIGVGWHSLRSAGNFQRSAFDFPAEQQSDARSFRTVLPLPLHELKPSAARFEGGSANIGGILALGASLELLQSFGIPNVWQRLQEVTQKIRELVQSLGGRVISCDAAERRSGIVACEFPGRSTERLRERAMPHGVVLNLRGGFVRLSPHAYTNDDDLDRLRRVLADLL
ncbi:MAG TPA: aminotransferase class V-fold PLP-dependent enzyme, partial [Planctomycetaceae bacterium]|nr:aminotransferase class V-fold PLP-dependent enzyme [Planctomycetaceae bacterium]